MNRGALVWPHEGPYTMHWEDHVDIVLMNMYIFVSCMTDNDNIYFQFAFLFVFSDFTDR